MGIERRTLHDQAQEVEDEPSDEPAAPPWFAVSRGAAFFFGAVSLLMLLGEMRFPHFSASAWWLDLHVLPKPAARGWLAATAALLVFFSFFPRSAPALRRLAALSTLGLLGLTFWNAWRFYQHLGIGQTGTDIPIPFNLHVAGALIVIVPGLVAAGWERSNFFKDFFVGALTLSICVVAFPVAQFACLGKSAGRETGSIPIGDAVVIFVDGAEAKSNPDGLAEQVRAACVLYREGKARKVVLASRGETFDETQNMLRRLATSERVPEKDLVQGSAAIEMEASVAATAKVLEDQKLARVLVTAPFYELPRLKLCCQRAGLDVRTVPVSEKLRVQELRTSLFREATALWLCYLQPLLM